MDKREKGFSKAFFLGLKKSAFCFAFLCVSFFSRLALSWLTVSLF
jgi:hypothetical protein